MRHKGFARDIAAMPPDQELTPRQRWWAAYICWRYRRQVSVEVREWAQGVLAVTPEIPKK